jgi:hypothetical protein
LSLVHLLAHTWSWSPVIRISQRSNDRPQRFPRRHSCIRPNLLDRLRPCSPRGTLTLGRLDHGIWALRQASKHRMRAAYAVPRCFFKACSAVSGLLSLGDRGKVSSRPGLSPGGMLQGASALNLEVARKAHGRCESKRHIRINCAGMRDEG